MHINPLTFSRRKIQLIAAYLTVYFIWGSTYLAIRFSVETLPPFFAGGIRFLTAGALFCCWGIFRHKSCPTLNGWKNTGISGFFLFFICFGGLTYAQQIIPSSVASLIIALEALWFSIFDWLFFKGHSPKLLEILALIVGFTGCILLIAGDPNARLSLNPQYFFWCIVLVFLGFSWVYGSLLPRKISIHEDVFTAAGMQMLCGGSMLTLASLVAGDWHKIQSGVSTFLLGDPVSYLMRISANLFRLPMAFT